MKKTLSILLALLMLSILPLNVLASDLPKSKIVDIDMTSITPRELPCFDGKSIVEGCYSSSDDEITTTSVYLCMNEDMEDYSFVITYDDINYETVYLDSISVPGIDLSEYYPANLLNGNNNIDYQDGKFHIYLHSWNNEVSYGCLETEDFKSFTFNAEPHIDGHYFTKTVNGIQDDYYLYAKTDKGYYIDFYDNDEEEYYMSFTQDFETVTRLVYPEDISFNCVTKDPEEDSINEIETDIFKSDAAKNGIVLHSSFDDIAYSVASITEKENLYYLSYENKFLTIDTSAVALPEIDIENNKGVITYGFTTDFGDFIYAVEGYTAEKTDVWDWNYWEKTNLSTDYYILNEENLKLEKLEISLKGYSEYSDAFTTGTVGAVIGTRTDGTYVAAEYFDGKGTEYDTGVKFNSFLYTYIYENSEDLAINEIVLSNYDDEYIYITVDGFETIYRLPLGENATLIAWTKLHNRIVSTYDEETGVQKYYLLDMSEVYKAIPELNNPNPAPEAPADLNGDGKLSVVDAKWLLQSVANSRELTDEQRALADVNGDGKITVVDAKWILQVVAGIREL